MASTYSVAALVLYAGSNALVQMTKDMVDELLESIVEAKTEHAFDARVLVVNNGSDPFVPRRFGGLASDMITLNENVGFANGFNAGIERVLADSITPPDYWLILNNDLRMPDKSWLRALFRERNPNLITCPMTDRTATVEAVAAGPKNKDPIRVNNVSAYAWLVPEGLRRRIEELEGFTLFDPDFHSYGEDNWTSLLLQHHIGPKPFRLIQRSWVQHLRARTASEVKPDRSAASKMLCDKVRGLLRRKTRSDVKMVATQYLRVLKR